MEGKNKNFKNKIMTAIKIIIGMTIVIGVITLHGKHEDARRASYAAEHNCTWSLYGAHDICK